MAGTRELMRVGTPMRAKKLMALLEAIEPGDEAIVRHYHGQLIIEEPEASLPIGAPPEGGS